MKTDINTSKWLCTCIVEISKFNDSELEIGEDGHKIIPFVEPQWITLRYVHPDLYDTQDEINDAAENFANEIARDTNRGVFIRVQVMIPDVEKGHLKGYKSELHSLIKSERDLR